MYKRFYLFVFASIIGVLGYAQQATGMDETMPGVALRDTIDYAKICAHYKMWVVVDVSAEKKKYRTYEMLLQMGEKVSKFSDYMRFLNDSASFAEERAGLSRMEVFANMMARARNARRTYYEEVFKNYPENNNTIVDNVVIKAYTYKEEIPVIDWTLVEGKSDTIVGYHCEKATCTFRGRTYEAWYAPDVPIGDGPWKFTGLPGLVLKVKDEAKDYYWTCTALYQPQWESPICIKEDLKKTSREKFRKAKKRAEEDPNALHANDPNAKIRTPSGEWVLASELNKGKYRPPYNPMELE